MADQPSGNSRGDHTWAPIVAVNCPLRCGRLIKRQRPSLLELRMLHQSQHVPDWPCMRASRNLPARSRAHLGHGRRCKWGTRCRLTLFCLSPAAWRSAGWGRPDLRRHSAEGDRRVARGTSRRRSLVSAALANSSSFNFGSLLVIVPEGRIRGRSDHCRRLRRRRLR